MTPRTETLQATTADIDRAARLLRAGALVAFPTETVYGLGADARQADAVAKIYAAKNRPPMNPLIVHVPNAEIAQEYVRWSDIAQQLADAFWPGPLTLVLPLHSKHGLSSRVTAKLTTLAIRVPAHHVAQALLRKFDGPLAAPSANPSGKISTTTADHVLAGLSGRIDAVIDGGACTVGLESTIISVASGPPALLRAGGVSIEAIERLLSIKLQTAEDGKIIAPGQLASHYAPRAPVRLNALAKKPHEVHLGFGPIEGDLNLSAMGDLTQAAAALFAALRQLDGHAKPIAVAPIPDEGLGRAINDRLRRAAAPRDTH
ncbi:MAG: L-threonylcarbamoyladenylate synthase [Pseudomonadota bacterium]